MSRYGAPVKGFETGAPLWRLLYAEGSEIRLRDELGANANRCVLPVLASCVDCVVSGTSGGCVCFKNQCAME